MQSDRRGSSFLTSFFGFIRGFINGTYKNDAGLVASRPAGRSPLSSYSPEKQKKLQALCEQLFAQKDLISTGKIQFLGLGKVKLGFGDRKWERMKPVIHEIVERAINRYLLPTDIHIRYRDDTYVIIFSGGDNAETQVRAALIAEAIRLELLNQEDESIRSIGIENSIATIKADNLKQANNLNDTMKLIVSGKADAPPPAVREKYVSIQPTIEVEVKEHASDRTTGDAIEQDRSAEKDKGPLLPKCAYVPLWDTKTNFLTTYLCLMEGKQPSADPMEYHANMFMGLPASRRTLMDLAMLGTVATDLKEAMEANRKLFFSCPVHYQTLVNSESHQEYIHRCQQILPEHKKFLIFLVLDLPEKISSLNIGRYFGALEKHCHEIHAQVPLSLKIDNSLLTSGHIGSIGVNLRKARGSEKEVIEKMNEFNELAKNTPVGKVFALGVQSLSVTTSAVCAGFDLLGGPAIHGPVHKPNSVYRFIHQDLFATLINDGEPTNGN